VDEAAAKAKELWSLEAQCRELMKHAEQCEAEAEAKSEDIRKLSTECDELRERAMRGEADALAKGKDLQKAEARRGKLRDFAEAGDDGSSNLRSGLMGHGPLAAQAHAAIRRAEARCLELKERASRSEAEVVVKGEELQRLSAECGELREQVARFEADALRWKFRDIAEDGADRSGLVGHGPFAAQAHAAIRRAEARCVELKERAERSEAEALSRAEDLRVVEAQCQDLKLRLEDRVAASPVESPKSGDLVEDLARARAALCEEEKKRQHLEQQLLHVRLNLEVEVPKSGDLVEELAGARAALCEEEKKRQHLEQQQLRMSETLKLLAQQQDLLYYKGRQDMQAELECTRIADLTAGQPEQKRRISLFAHDSPELADEELEALHACEGREQEASAPRTRMSSRGRGRQPNSAR